jgi:hypothetical protein
MFFVFGLGILSVSLGVRFRNVHFDCCHQVASDFAKSSRAVAISRAMTRVDGVRASPLWLAFSARRRR